jgi:hypothetical protein
VRDLFWKLLGLPSFSLGVIASLQLIVKIHQ